MTHFIRISHQNNSANKLQEYILQLVKKYDCVLSTDPEAVFSLVEQLITQANRAYPRCTAQHARASRDHKTSTLTSFHVGGLITVSIHTVAGQFPKPESQPAPAVQPVAVPKPELPPPPPPTKKPRTAIYENREVSKIVRLEEWERFAPRTQLLLKRGSVWKIYYDSTRNIVVEEFGGRLQPAF